MSVAGRRQGEVRSGGRQGVGATILGTAQDAARCAQNGTRRRAGVILRHWAEGSSNGWDCGTDDGRNRDEQETDATILGTASDDAAHFVQDDERWGASSGWRMASARVPDTVAR